MSFLRRITFNLWYYQDHPWDTGISPPALMDFIQTYSPGRSLELGCGTGNNVITFAWREWQVAGLDFARQSG